MRVGAALAGTMLLTTASASADTMTYEHLQSIEGRGGEAAQSLERKDFPFGADLTTKMLDTITNIEHAYTGTDRDDDKIIPDFGQTDNRSRRLGDGVGGGRP